MLKGQLRAALLGRAYCQSGNHAQATLLVVFFSWSAVLSQGGSAIQRYPSSVAPAFDLLVVHESRSWALHAHTAHQGQCPNSLLSLPVNLKAQVCKCEQADRILFLDACFSVVIFHGATIAQWRKQEFHLQADYAGFKDLLEVMCSESSSGFKRTLATVKTGKSAQDIQ